MTEEMLTGAPPRPSKQFSRNWQKTYRDALGVRRAKKDAQRAAAAAEQALADEQSLAAAMALVIEQAHAEEQARLLASTRYSPSRDSSGPGIASGPGSSSSRKGKEKVTGGSSARGGRATPTTPRARGVSIPGTQGDHGPSGGLGTHGTQGLTPGGLVTQARRGNLSNSRKAGKPYVCDTCGLTYSNQGTLISHLKSHEEDYKCHDCDKNYNNKSSFNKHMRKFHGAEKEIPSSDIKPYECDECHKRFTNRDGVVQHKASHTDATTCPVCQKKYGKIASLKEHINKKHPGTG
nr:PREDICTED: zinc finger protein 629-like [Bemisia tabaci]